MGRSLGTDEDFPRIGAPFHRGDGGRVGTDEQQLALASAGDGEREVAAVHAL